MGNFLNALSDRVLLCDGGMGSVVQSMDLSVENDFMGKENCTEALLLSRPDVIRGIHTQYFAAGADAVETDTFGATPTTLGEFDLQDSAFEINKLAAEVAREAADSFTDGRERFVIGSIGPGTKLPSLGHISYDELEAGFQIQCSGLNAGGVDVFLIETCQDPLQIKAAVNGAKLANAASGVQTPIMVQVTVETTGTMLVGSDVAAAVTAIQALDVDSFGLNCATGPAEMAPHVQWLSENWPGFLSLQPNAGLPELVDGKTVYPQSPKELADWHKRFILEDGVNMVGGCCGTGPAHIAAIDSMLRELGGARLRPAPIKRDVHWVPSVASLYGQVPMRQENAFLSIGERCNANGSKKFREFQDSENWDGIVGMAREQVKEASHTLDVCTAFVGRNEMSDMTEVVSRLRGSVDAPLVIDSTDTKVIEAALKLYGGKAIINSINFENGEDEAAERLVLARKFGASVIALTIDEDGMAKDAADKVKIAKRLYEFACVKHGLPASDLMFDPLTFTICTGNPDDRGLAMQTLDAIQQIRKELPECQIVLGLSNVSFGLKPSARHVLNSVFLDHCLKVGMTGAILHVSKIKPTHSILEEEVKIAEDLIFARHKEDYDPLQAFIRLFEDKDDSEKKVRAEPKTPEERLKLRVVDGNRVEIEKDLEEALKSNTPLEIINGILLDGMKVVGELFGSGKMQLPFVLQSAETMKASVAYLEQFMEKIEGQEKGVMVLATVKGDVHDIGKNLVDIILTNNGYKIHNIGIKQTIDDILKAVDEFNPDVIGLSGLLVKSTVIMKENLEEMARRGLTIPVILGGAALTRKYVEQDCVDAYTTCGRVSYARDAFDCLEHMGMIVDGSFDDYLAQQQTKRANRPSNQKRELGRAKSVAERPIDWDMIKTRRSELARNPVPVPPFWGPRIVEHVPLKSLIPFVNERMLYQFQWGYKKQGKTLDEWLAMAAKEIRPIFHDLVQRCEAEKILQPKASYGYWPCATEGDSVVLFDPKSGKECARFAFPRQAAEDGLCISDFFRDIDSQERDVIGLQVVTVGQNASDVARDWFAQDKYQDYLYLHGVSVEMAEALAEHTHKRIRAELGFSSEDERDLEKMLNQGYRGSRYSFGYPACPNLEDQDKILDLLQAEKIGVTLSDEFQLEPEQSTSAIVLHHPQAKYFSI